MDFHKEELALTTKCVNTHNIAFHFKTSVNFIKKILHWQTSSTLFNQGIWDQYLLCRRDHRRVITHSN